MDERILRAGVRAGNRRARDYMRSMLQSAVMLRLARLPNSTQAAVAIRFCRSSCPPASLVIIYRSRNVRAVEALCAEARRMRWPIILWSLDDVPAELASETVGVGPGPRSALLNRLIPMASKVSEYVLVSDDDVQLSIGSLRLLILAAARCGFDLAGAAHARGSFYSHRITRRRLWCFARITTFVEIGPLLVMRSDIGSSVFAGAASMGWGTELTWYQRAVSGEWRLGLIDAVTMKHLRPAGTAYALGPQRERMRELLRSHGVSDWNQVQVVLDTISVGDVLLSR